MFFLFIFYFFPITLFAFIYLSFSNFNKINKDVPLCAKKFKEEIESRLSISIIHHFEDN